MMAGFTMRKSRYAAVAMMLLATACSEGANTGPDAASSASLDLATVAADATAEDVDVMVGMDGSLGSTDGSALLLLNPPGRPGLTGCTFAAGAFDCPPVNRNGLTIDRTIVLKDAQGQAQAAYDELTTASVEVQASVEGSVTRGPWSADIDRTRTFTISGLVGTETTRTVNGTGTADVSRSRHTGTDSVRSYDLVGTSVVANVVVPVRAPGVVAWPISGTITRTYTVTPTGSGGGSPFTRTIVITFNGTSTVMATSNGEEFTIDLAARRAERRERRG